MDNDLVNVEMSLEEVSFIRELVKEYTDHCIGYVLKYRADKNIIGEINKEWRDHDDALREIEFIMTSDRQNNPGKKFKTLVQLFPAQIRLFSKALKNFTPTAFPGLAIDYEKFGELLLSKLIFNEFIETPVLNPNLRVNVFSPGVMA